MAKRDGRAVKTRMRYVLGVRVMPDMDHWLVRQSDLHGLDQSTLVRRILRYHMRHSKKRADLQGVLFGK